MYSYLNSLTLPQIEQLLQLYQQTWWAKERTLEDVQRMLRQSDFLFGVWDGERQELVAFARVLTDGVYRAIVFDVVVDGAYRGEGLGRSLLHHITSHPVLSQVECLHLFCLPDMVPFYEQFGFELPSQQLMVRQRRPA